MWREWYSQSKGTGFPRWQPSKSKSGEVVVKTTRDEYKESLKRFFASFAGAEILADFEEGCPVDSVTPEVMNVLLEVHAFEQEYPECGRTTYMHFKRVLPRAGDGTILLLIALYEKMTVRICES